MRVFYFGLVNTEKYAAAANAPLHVGAASVKIQSILHGLVVNGVRAYLVTQPVHAATQTVSGARRIILRERGAVSLFLPTSSNRYLRVVIGFVRFATFCMLKVRRGDRVILYNAEPEFILALFILRIRGIAPFLDIEDHIPAPATLRWWMKKWLLNEFIRRTDQRKLVASQQLADSLNVSSFCVVHGVLSRDIIETPSATELQSSSAAAGNLHVHFGGQASVQAGFGILIDLITHLGSRKSQAASNIYFHITGREACEAFARVSARLPSEEYRVNVYGDLARQEFLALIRACHISINLRQPGSDLECYTFPSKVVEITGLGVALITTRTNGLPDIFLDSEVFFVNEYSTDAVADVVFSCARDIEAVKRVASAGKLRARRLYTAAAVGERILKFIEG